MIGQHTEISAAGEKIITNDGTGYRISLVIALILCLIAMAVIFLYREDTVMGIIEKNHKEMEEKTKQE